MKTKITLTKEQVDKLVEAETKALQIKFDRDVASLRKRYEVVEIEIDGNAHLNKIEKEKFTDEDFIKLINEGKEISEIASITKYNKAYIYKIRKRILSKESLK